MHTHRRALSALVTVIASLAAVACGSDPASDAETGGAGGAGAATSGGASTASGGSGADVGQMGGAGGGAACSASGKGQLTLDVKGLPSGVAADINLSGAVSKVASASQTFTDLPRGSYSVAAESVTGAEPLVRTLYEPTPALATVCVSGAPSQHDVSYASVNTSGKLWVISSEPANLQGFASAALQASNAAAPTLAMEAKAGRDVAFDRDGNVWTFGPTLAEASLMRYSRTAFANSGVAEPDRALYLSDQACTTLHAMAFDPNGALWVSSCGTVFRYDDATLSAREGSIAADAIISNLDDNFDVAFDHAGNLWVTDAGFVKRYDAARLGASIATPADAVLSVQSLTGDAGVSASHLAFDADGDLWVVDFGGNSLSEVKASALTAVGSRDVTASVSVTLSVSALLARPAFDDAGGLWISYERGQVAHLSASALHASSDPGAPTLPDIVLSSASIGYADNVAFFPAPAGLPLYHSWK